MLKDQYYSEKCGIELIKNSEENKAAEERVKI